jgi:hypothetical protein
MFMSLRRVMFSVKMWHLRVVDHRLPLLIITLLFMFFRNEPIIVWMRTFGVSEDLRGVFKAEFFPVIWWLPLPLDGG